MKTLTYEEYQAKVGNLKTPEDIAAFVKDLIAPVAEPAQEEAPVAPKPRKRRVLLDEADPDGFKKYDVTGNDTEDKVIALYAKGLTTRDISSRRKLFDSGCHSVKPGKAGAYDLRKF